MSIDVAVGFGGVALVGVIAMVVHWLLGRRESANRRSAGNYPARTGPAPDGKPQ